MNVRFKDIKQVFRLLLSDELDSKVVDKLDKPHLFSFMFDQARSVDGTLSHLLGPP